MLNWGKQNNFGQQPLGSGSTNYGIEDLLPAMSSWGNQQAITPWATPNLAEGRIPGIGAAMPGAAPGMMDSFSSWFKGSGFLGSTDKMGIKTDGWGGPAIAAGKGLFDAFNSYKTGKLAQKSFDLSKKVAEANLQGAKQSYNTSLRDKRADAFGEASADEYIAKNRIA